MNVVVENPAGPIALGVSSTNPYKDCPPSTDDTTWVYFGDSAIQIDDADILLALDLERHAGFVRVLTAIDVIMSLLNFVLIGYVFSILTCLVAYIGYHGTVLYRRSMIAVYLVYQCLLTIGRGVLTGYVFNDHDDQNLLIIAFISFMVQLYITWYVWKFYSMLPKLVC